jgi:hypothetical protein
MLFYQLGELFQSVAVGKSRRSIAALMDIKPEVAIVIKDGEELELGVSEIGISVYNHLIGYAAEEARENGTVVDLDAYCKKHGFQHFD